jgi:hypothetical protein
MITTSDILIENFNNDSTEYSFNVIISNGDLTEKVCVAVEYDELDNLFYVDDCTGREKRREYTTKFKAHYTAIQLIQKYKKQY